jgi:hypothetical protein
MGGHGPPGHQAGSATVYFMDMCFAVDDSDIEQLNNFGSKSGASLTVLELAVQTRQCMSYITVCLVLYR